MPVVSWLMSAIYFFITHPAYTRFSVFELALSVLMDFVKCRRECVVLFRGLLFLCLFIVRRRAVTCAESSALRQDGTVTSASTPASAAASATPNSVHTTTAAGNKNNKSAGAWLRTPYEVVFIKLEHVSHEFGLSEEKLRGNLSNEASFLLPLLPVLISSDPNERGEVIALMLIAGTLCSANSESTSRYRKVLQRSFHFEIVPHMTNRRRRRVSF
ncbi:hypothetical protein C4B63_2g242 [Trypanosoma cruzi]|uniref:Uncharacterized protein n=1 Tax=Trypanosoma cruzi TaxID=5693 RepID=A0A2V2W1T6_TRYCR|nr:hypothetical protein C4B63_2g242 [Trypanosoma cruzi]